MNLRNIFTTALGCFTILAACGNDNDSNITPTPEPKPDQPTEEAKDVTLYVTNTSRTYDLTKSGLAFGTGSNMSPSTVTLDPATRYQEMDGFGANEGVILIAATNRPDVLDPALMRPGRFDRQVVVSYPDVNGREAILRVHARKKPLAPDVNLKTIAKTTAGFTGADLENLLNEAALLAARKDKKAITMDEIKEATVKVVVGAEKKSKVMSEKEKKLTAYHEAGHAILFDKLETQDPVHEISIIPTGMAGGYTMPLPSEDKSYNSRRGMYEDIVVSLGGRVAEELIMDDISTGASNDIEKATKTARAMVTKYGMTKELGCVCYGTDNNSVFLGRDMGSRTQDYSEATAAKIDQLVLDMVNKAYGDATKILSDNMDKLHDIAKYLIKHEKMGSEDFTAVMNGTYKEPEEVEQETADKEPSAETKVDESTEG